MARRLRIALGEMRARATQGALVIQSREASLPPVPFRGGNGRQKPARDWKPRQLHCARAINSSIRAGSAFGARPSRTAREVSGSLSKPQWMQMSILPAALEPLAMGPQLGDCAALRAC